MTDDPSDFLSLLMSSDLFSQDDQDMLSLEELESKEAPEQVSHNIDNAKVKPIPSKPFKPLKAKRSRRLEIRLLRDEFAHLSSLHEALETRRRDSLKQEPVHSAPSTPLDDSSSWKDIAHEQLQRREVSVQENLRLRNQLAEIAELGGRLELQLKHQRTHLRDVKPSPCGYGSLHVYADEHQAYTDLLDRIPHLYGRTREVVDQQRMQYDLNEAHVHDVHISDTDALVKVDLFEARLMPFELHATANAVWEWMAIHRDPVFQCSCEQHIVVPTTVQRSFVGEIEIKSTRFCCRGRVVFRRYDELDRVVFVATALLHPHDTTAVVQHNQWIVVTRPPMVPSATSACTEIRCVDTVEVVGLQVHDGIELRQLITDGLNEHRDEMNAFVDTKLIHINRQ